MTADENLTSHFSKRNCIRNERYSSITHKFFMICFVIHFFFLLTSTLVRQMFFFSATSPASRSEAFLRANSCFKEWLEFPLRKHGITLSKKKIVRVDISNRWYIHLSSAARVESSECRNVTALKVKMGLGEIVSDENWWTFSGISGTNKSGTLNVFSPTLPRQIHKDK